MSLSHSSKLLRTFQGKLALSDYSYVANDILCLIRFYRATRDLHSLLIEIENKEDKVVLSFIEKAKHDFEQEIKSEFCIYNLPEFTQQYPNVW